MNALRGGRVAVFYGIVREKAWFDAAPEVIFKNEILPDDDTDWLIPSIIDNRKSAAVRISLPGFLNEIDRPGETIQY